jgi:hypothetical protein
MRNVVVIPPKAMSIAGASSLPRTECDGYNVALTLKDAVGR